MPSSKNTYAPRNTYPTALVNAAHVLRRYEENRKALLRRSTVIPAAPSEREYLNACYTLMPHVSSARQFNCWDLAVTILASVGVKVAA